MKAKNKRNYIFEFYKQSVASSKFVLVFLLSIVISFYAVIQIAFNTNYSIGFVRIYTNGIYVMALLLILLLNSKITFDNFEQNQSFIIRFSTRKKYLKELIKNCCFSSFCTLLLNIVLVMIGLNIFNPNTSLPDYEIFPIASKYYIIFVLFKFLILSQIITILNVLLLKIINKKIVIPINILLYVLIGFNSVQYSKINAINQIPLFIGDYFCFNIYNSFAFEISCFLLYASILFAGITILNSITKKRMRDIGQ